VVETAPLKNKQEVQDKIGSIRPGGGTNMYPALEAAYNSLKKADVKVKHIILLSDGVSKGEGNYDQLLQQMAKDKITLTTVAVGNDADTGLLARLAKLGSGRYYFTDDIESIPKIFAKETFLATRSYIVQEPFTPTLTRSTTMLSGEQTLPQLFGYVATTPKDTAEEILTSHQGDPILARWSYGLGKAVAWTSDTKGRWASQWVDWSTFPQFWGKVFSWTFPQEQDNGMVVATSRDGGEGTIRVDIPGERRKAHDIRVKIIAPDGVTSEKLLQAEGPGQYRTTFPMEQQGAYMLQVAQQEGEQVVRQQTAGMVLPYSPEYLMQPEQSQFLEQLAANGGGRVLKPTDPAELVGTLPVPAVWGKLVLWPKLLLLAALLFPLDIAARRFNLNFRWIIGLKLWLQETFSRSRTQLEHGREELLVSLQQQKSERKQFYHARSNADAITSASSHEQPTGQQPKPTTQVKPDDNSNRGMRQGKTSKDNDQTPGQFTSRLLNAKKRASTKNQDTISPD
jgi:Ca-activated chloride channel homolog